MLQGCVLEKGLTYIWIGMYKRRSPTVQIVSLAVSNNKKVKLLTLAFVSWHTTFARNCVVIILSDFGEHSSQHAQCALNLGEARIFHTLDGEAWTERPRELRFFFYLTRSHLTSGRKIRWTTWCYDVRCAMGFELSRRRAFEPQAHLMYFRLRPSDSSRKTTHHHRRREELEAQVRAGI